MKVIVIGGGPAGMMAAITSAENENEVILLEKNKGLGKKLLITGKGRCNITSSLPMEDFIKNTPGNGMFLYSAYNKFTNQDIISFLKKQGLDVKEERGNRIFPVTDKSQDVLNCFEKKLKKPEQDELLTGALLRCIRSFCSGLYHILLRYRSNKQILYCRPKRTSGGAGRLTKCRLRFHLCAFSVR